MNPHYGRCVGIDRAARRCSWLPDFSDEPVPVVLYDRRAGKEPWPGARVAVDASGRTPQVLHTIGERRDLFHDDFVAGHDRWVVDDLFGSFSASALASAAAGGVRITADNGAGFFRKDYGVRVPVDESKGLLLTARVRSVDAPMGSGVSETISVGWTGDSASAPPFADVSVGMLNDQDRWSISANNQFGAGGIVEIEGTEQSDDWRYVDALLVVATGDSGTNHAVTGYGAVDGNYLVVTDAVGGSGAGSPISVAPNVFVVASSTVVRADVDFITGALVDVVLPE